MIEVCDSWKDAMADQAKEYIEIIQQLRDEIDRLHAKLQEIDGQRQIAVQERDWARLKAEEARKTDRSWVDGQDYADDVEFLLDELAEERAAHNAHVTELCELEKENRKLREDIEKIIKILKNGQPAHRQTFKIRQLLEVTLE